MSSLMDAQITSPAVDHPSQHSETPPANSGDPTWYIDEGVPGVGQRPEWLDEKFKTVAEVARSYSELQKKLGSTEAPPEHYSFGDLEVNLDNPHIKDMMSYAKEHRISQDAFSAMVNGLAGYAESYAPDMAKELERLGPNGQDTIKEIGIWASNNLSPEARKTLNEMATKAEVIQMMDEIRRNSPREVAQPPMGHGMNAPTPPLTLKEVQAEMSNNLARYETDPRYRAEITAKFERATK